MTREEAIKIAKQLSHENKRMTVLFDKEFNDFFITEGEYFHTENDFYKSNPYKVVETF